MREDTSLWHTNRDLGQTGLAAVSFDGMGPEELFAASPSDWVVLGRGLGERLDVVLQARSFGNGRCRKARVDDVDADGKPDVVALVWTGSSPYDVDLVVYDLFTGAEKERQWIYSSSELPKALLVGNVEGGPEAEIFVVNRDDLWMLRVGEPAVWVFPGAGGTGLALGNLDVDPQPELVVATGLSVTAMVIEPTLRKVEWAYTPGFGSSVTVADVDADGRGEIFGTSDGKLVRIDGVTRSRVWSGPSTSSGWQTSWVDVERDGEMELLLADSGHLTKIDPRTGARTQEISSLLWPPVSIDLGACQPGLVGLTYYGMVYWSLATGEVLPIGPLPVQTWFSPWFAAGPLLGDGRTRLLWSAYGQTLAGQTRLFGVLDLHHGWEERREESGRWGPVALAQLDGDPALEYAASDSGGGRVFVLDGATHAVEWATGLLHAPVRTVDFLDTDGNGKRELVVGTGVIAPSHVRFYDAESGVFLWKSADLPGGLRSVALGEVDGGPGPELLLAVLGSGLHAFDATTRQEEWVLPVTDIWAVAVGNVNADATPDFVIGTTSGAYAAYDGPTRALLFQGSLGGARLGSLRVVDVDGDGTAEIVAGYGSGLSTGAGGGVAIVRAADRSVLWRSPSLPDGSDVGSSMLVTDADDDGMTEILFGHASGVAAYEYDPGAPDLEPPAWQGPPGILSVTPSTQGCCPEVSLSWGVAVDAASPPVSYRIYRGPSGFTPSDATLVAETSAPTLRQRGVSPLSTYEFVVRAVDRLGNEDLNDVRISATIPAERWLVIEPPTATICPEGEVELKVVAGGASPSTYTWYRDGSPVSYGSSSYRTSLEGTYQCFVDVGACDRRPARPSVVTVIRKRGDVSGDCDVALPDLFALSAYLAGYGHWVPQPVTDVDGIGALDKNDIDRLADFLLGGAPPPAP